MYASVWTKGAVAWGRIGGHAVETDGSRQAGRSRRTCGYTPIDGVGQVSDAEDACVPKRHRFSTRSASSEATMNGSREVRHHSSEVEDLRVGIAWRGRSSVVRQFQVLASTRAHAVGNCLPGEDEAGHPPMDRAFATAWSVRRSRQPSFSDASVSRTCFRTTVIAQLATLTGTETCCDRRARRNPLTNLLVKRDAARRAAG